MKILIIIWLGLVVLAWLKKTKRLKQEENKTMKSTDILNICRDYNSYTV